MEQKKEIIEAADIINKAIKNNTTTQLPFTTVENLSIIQHFINVHDCKATLNGIGTIEVAEITPATNLKITESFYIKGETTVYGKIVRVGGAKHRVRIETDNGKQFTIITRNVKSTI